MNPSTIRVRILVQDFKKMFDFYKNVMEYKVIWGDRDGTYASFGLKDQEQAEFAIYVKEDYSFYQGYTDNGSDTKSDYIVMCMGCDDVDEYYHYLKAKGVEFIGEPRDIPEWYYRVVLMRDPEGNLIDIGSAMKEQKNIGD